MRGIVRNSQFANIQEIVNAADEASKENYRFQQLLKIVVEAAFGKESNKGILSERVEHYFKESPLEWAEELNELVHKFSPQGPLLSGNSSSLISTSDRSVSIDPKILPRSAMDEFTGSGDRQSSKIRSLRRQFSDKFYINNWEWFWCHVAHALSIQSDIEDKRSFQEDYNEDQLFFMLTRNPLLIILRKGLSYNYKKDAFLMERMRGIFELYFIEDLSLTTKRKEKKYIDSKYHLKSHYLAAIFLLIHSRKGKFTGETFEIYDQFFIRASEYYSSITTQSSGQNVRFIVRVWLYLMTRQYSLDSMLVIQAENANPTDGWYKLSRCPLQQWVKAIRKVEFQSYQLPLVVGMKKNVYKLIARQTQWTPSFAFLAAIEQFLEFDEVVLSKYVRKQSQKEEDETLSKSFEKILIFLAQNGANCQILYQIQENLNTKYKARLKTEMNINFKLRSEQARQNLSKTSRQKLKTISYQSPRLKNVWQHPPQQNEFYIFFEFSYWVARQLDKIIPGHQHRKYPCLNIRIFSNPYIFFVSLFIFLFIIKWIFDL